MKEEKELFFGRLIDLKNIDIKKRIVKKQKLVNLFISELNTNLTLTVS